ncbi:unnamed protein product [Rhodiola kirilowii]
MKVKALVAFKAKLSSPCRKILVLLRLKKPRYTRSRRPSSPRSGNHQVCASFPLFRTHKKPKEMNRVVRELRSVSEKLITPPLPITPVSAKRVVPAGEENNVVEEACRSFEKYLLEMIVEEGNVKDVMDVEELLYCWKKLKSPVFVELVSRFYGELCKDLFSPEDS